MTLTLAPLPRTDIAHVAHLHLPAHQAPFVGDIAEMTDEPDTKQEFHFARAGSNIIGFFKIDRDFSRHVAQVPPGGHGLRGLLIGGQFQGKGYGAALLQALPQYVARSYPIKHLWLAVDAANTPAITLYERTGWTHTGTPTQGRSGLEHLMVCRLPAADHFN